MIVNGINKYVSAETQEKYTDEIGESTVKHVAIARPKQTPSTTSSSPTITLPYHQRHRTDVEPGKFDKHRLKVSKLMTKLLRHDHTVSREEDGAVKFGILASMFHSKFTSSPYWSIRTWLNYLQKGAFAAKKRLQYCVESCSADAILYLRAIEGHSEQGLQFNQTRSNAILYNTLPAVCIEKVVIRKS